MFALRPFWRWQTQGAYSLVFNAILHWNDLDAGTIALSVASSRPSDIIVIGAGIVGCAVAYELARRGASVQNR